MQIVSAEEMSQLKAKLEELRKSKVEVQNRITAAAGLGDLSENAEYHFAKEENRRLEKELGDLEKKVKGLHVVNNDDVPDGMVYLGHTVKLLDLSDDSETLVKLVGEASSASSGGDDVLVVTSTSPMGEALLKAQVGTTIKVRAPRGSMEFKILEIV